MTTRRLSLLLLLAFLAACGAGLTDSAAGVATQRLTASASGVSATFMRQDNPSAVIGAGSVMQSKASGTGGTRHALVSFSSLNVPAGQVITGATLTLTATGYSGAPVIEAHAVTAAWSRASASWATFCPSGCAIDPTVAGSVNASGSTIAIDVTSIVAAWYAGAPNYGIALVNSGASGTFASMHADNGSAPPTLTIAYSPAPQDAGTDASADAGSDAGGCAPGGGESIAPVASCVRTPDTSIVGGTMQYGPDATYNLMTVWQPPTCTANCPAVGLIHGGGFTTDGGGRASSALTYYAQVLAGLGYVAVSIDYRLMSGSYPSVTNGYPAAVNDGLAAQAYLVSNASALHIDPARIGWAGFSAGGHIAAKVALAGGVKRLALWYSNLYFDTPGWWSAAYPAIYNYAGCAAGDGACLTAAAPAINATPGASSPPTLLMHDTADATVSEAMSARYRSEAQCAGALATEVQLSGVGHGFAPSACGTGNCTGPLAPATCTALAFWAGL